MPHWSLNLDAVIWSPIPTLWTSKYRRNWIFKDWFCHSNGNFKYILFYPPRQQPLFSSTVTLKPKEIPRKKLALRQLPLPWSFLSAAASWNAAPPPRVARHSSNPSFSEDVLRLPVMGKEGPFPQLEGGQVNWNSLKGEKTFISKGLGKRNGNLCLSFPFKPQG